MNRLIDFLCFTQPFRKVLLHSLDFLPEGGQEWLLDRLYPTYERFNTK